MAVAVLASTLAMAVAGYAVAKTLAPSNVATIDLLVLPNEQGLIDEALVRTFESVLSAEAFAAEVGRQATTADVGELTSTEVASSISTSRSPTSSLIEVRVVRPDPESATAIAELIGPTVDELLTVGGIEASAFYQQVFPEPLVQEESALSSKLAAAIGGVVGFLLGLTAVLLWSVRQPVVTTTENIGELAGYPVVARLPRQSGRWRQGRTNVLDPLAAAVAQVRDTGVTGKGGVVAVVSPVAEAAMSFAVDFASLLAQSGDGRVLLVDGDYRSASLTSRLDLEGHQGWDQIDFSNGLPEGALGELLETLPSIPSSVSDGSGWSRPLAVPVGKREADEDRSTVEQLALVLDALSAAGVLVVACPPVPGDVPAAPAIIAASAVLIVAPLGITAPDDMRLLGELVASLSDAPAGVVVVEQASAG